MTDEPISHKEWLQLLFLRAGKEKSYALEQGKYFDPQANTKFEGEKNVDKRGAKSKKRGR